MNADVRKRLRLEGCLAICIPFVSKLSTKKWKPSVSASRNFPAGFLWTVRVQRIVEYQETLDKLRIFFLNFATKAVCCAVKRLLL